MHFTRLKGVISDTILGMNDMLSTGSNTNAIRYHNLI